MSLHVFTTNTDDMAPAYPKGAAVFADTINPADIRAGHAYLLATSIDKPCRLCRCIRAGRKTLVLSIDKTGETARIRRDEIGFAAVAIGINHGNRARPCEWFSGRNRT